MYDSNIKSFNIRGLEVETPQIYNLYIKETAKVAISAITKHWRYNREIRGINRPLSLVVAKYDSKTKTFSEIEGKFDALEAVEYVKIFSEGLYAIWVFCNYDASETPKPKTYNVTFSSSTKYRVRKVTTDFNYQFIRELILAAALHINKENPFGSLLERNILQSGLSCLVIYNSSESIYECRENQLESKDMSLLPPFKDQEKFDFIVPPLGYNICIGMKKKNWAWFNMDSNIKGHSFDPSENYKYISKFNQEFFIYHEVCLDDVENDHYYDYTSTSHEEAKRELKFRHLNLKDIVLEDLKNEYPKLMEMVLALSGEDNENYIWTKIMYDENYYVGQLDAKSKLMNGRGAYHWRDVAQIYVGYWEDSNREKTGCILDEDFKIKYQGGFLKNKKHGKGLTYYANGDIYDGEYFEGIMSGHAKYTWNDGSTWEGPFVNDQMNGEGIYLPYGGGSFKAEFRNNNFFSYNI
jgi:hypothetical protein